MIAEHQLVNRVMHQIGRLVGPHGDLFEDDLLLRCHVVVTQRRTAQDVAEDLHGQLRILGNRADVVRRVLFGRVGVHLAPDFIDRLRQLQRRAILGPLEGQMFEEVRAARLILGFVAAPHADPHGRANR